MTFANALVSIVSTGQIQDFAINDDHDLTKVVPTVRTFAFAIAKKLMCNLDFCSKFSQVGLFGPKEILKDLFVRSPFMVWAPSSYGRAAILWFRQKFCPGPLVTLGPGTPTPTPYPPHWRSPKPIWAIYSIHIWEVGWMSWTWHLDLGTPYPPPLKASKGQYTVSTYGRWAGCSWPHVTPAECGWTPNLVWLLCKKDPLLGKYSYGCHFAPNQLRDLKLGLFGSDPGAECSLHQI